MGDNGRGRDIESAELEKDTKHVLRPEICIILLEPGPFIKRTG